MDLKNAALESLPSSSRVMRNLAEKQRRDKLNAFIGELATLVPVVATASRKLDKTSILRLSANFLRLHQNLDLRDLEKREPRSPRAAQIGHMVLNALEGFLLVICPTGKVMYVSEGVEKLLGHSQVDMMGLPLYCFVHPDDQNAVQQHLAGLHSQASASRSEPESSRSHYSFECRLAGRPVARGEPINYERVQITGHLRTPSSQEPKSKCRTTQVDPLRSQTGSCVEASNGQGSVRDAMFVGVVRLIPQHPPISTSLTILDSMRDQYITRHLPDGRIIHTDHRISIIAGYFTEEVHGKSAFSFIYTEDLHWTLLGFKLMAGNPNGEGLTVYRLVSRTGELIYLRSRGFVELDSATQQMVSFVCVNSLLSSAEGEVEIHRIREMLTNQTAEQPAALSSLKVDAITFPGWKDPSTNSGTVVAPAATPTAPAPATAANCSGSSSGSLSSFAQSFSPASTAASPAVAPVVAATPPPPPSPATPAAASTQVWRFRNGKEASYVNRASLSGGYTSSTKILEDLSSPSPSPSSVKTSSPVRIDTSPLMRIDTSPRGIFSEDSTSSSSDYRSVLSPRGYTSPTYPTRSGCGPIRYRRSRSSKDFMSGSPTASASNA